MSTTTQPRPFSLPSFLLGALAALCVVVLVLWTERQKDHATQTRAFEQGRTDATRQLPTP